MTQPAVTYTLCRSLVPHGNRHQNDVVAVSDDDDDDGGENDDVRTGRVRATSDDVSDADADDDDDAMVAAMTWRVH